jgi:hypothetical protein
MIHGTEKKVFGGDFNSLPDTAVGFLLRAAQLSVKWQR